MAVKAWFDYETYMSNKLNQMVKAEPSAGWTADSLKAAFEKAGFYGDTGAQAHFLKYGHKEDVSPNEKFDADYYYQAKALQWYQTAEGGSVAKDTILANLSEYGNKMEAIIKGAGMDAWTHYTKYGTKEGINPSNDFDTSNYMAAKIAAMNGTMTADEVYAAFKKAGMNALAHAEMYAGKGGAETTAAVDTFVVPEEEQLPTSEPTGDVTALTMNIDNLSGKAFVAEAVTDPHGTIVQTLQTGDTLTGTGDSNSLDVTWSATAAAGAVTPTMSNVQTLNVKNVSSVDDLDINGSFITGLTTVNVKDSLVGQGVDIDALASKVENVSVTNSNAGANIEIANSLLTGDADALNVTLDGALSNNAGLASVVVTSNGSAGYETVSVTTANNASTVDRVFVEGAQTMTFGGDKDLTISATNGEALATTFTKLDASAFTGKLNVGEDNALTTDATADKSVEITSGTGDDTFYIDDMGDKYVFNAGDGTDTLYFVGNTDVTASYISNVEKVGAVLQGRFGVDNDVTLNLKDAEGIEELILGKNGDPADTVTLKGLKHNSEQDFTITAVGDGEKDLAQTFNGVKYSPKNTVTDKAHVTMNVSNDGAAAGNVTLGQIDLGSIENVTLNVTDLSSTSDVIANQIAGPIESFSFTADGGNTVDLGEIGEDSSLRSATITSDADVTVAISQGNRAGISLHGKGDFTVSLTGEGSNASVDTSDVEGDVTVSVDTAAAAAPIVVNGTDGDDTITDNSLGAGNTINGKAGNDTLTDASATGGGTLNGGDGNDTLTANAAGSTLNGENGNDILIGGAAVDTITGGKGADTLTGNGGNDIFVFAGGDSTVGSIDVLEDFTSAADSIHINGLKGAHAFVGTFAAPQNLNVTASEVTLDVINALLNSSDGTGTKFAGGGNNTQTAFVQTTDTNPVLYAVIDVNADGMITEAADLVIDITGTAALLATDIVAA